MLRNDLGRIKENLRFVCKPIRKPLLLKQIIGSYLKFFARKKPIRNVDVALDYGCNLKCKHCSCATLMKQNESKLAVDDYKRLGKECFDLGAVYISFTGGEPLLQQNLAEIIQCFYPKRMLIGIQTNLVLLNQELGERLFRAGLDVLQVSLDSAQPDLHDAFRGINGAYKKTIDNIETALAIGYRVILCTTVSKKNVYSDNFEKILKYSQKINVPLVLSIACPVGRWKGNLDILLGDSERKHLDYLFRKYSTLRRDFHSNYVKKGCSGGTEKLYITPYGDVIPCPFIHISFGNVKKEPLKKIRDRMISLKEFTLYNQVCLAGEDLSFIKKYQEPTFNVENLPMIYNEHPALMFLD